MWRSTPRHIIRAIVEMTEPQAGETIYDSAAQVSALQNATFYGNDVDPKMVRLATMNLTLRGLPDVRTPE